MLIKRFLRCPKDLALIFWVKLFTVCADSHFVAYHQSPDLLCQPPLFPPAYGALSCPRGNRFNEVCVVACNEGYTIRGYRSIACRSPRVDGTAQWDSEMATCESRFCIYLQGKLPACSGLLEGCKGGGGSRAVLPLARHKWPTLLVASGAMLAKMIPAGHTWRSRICLIRHLKGIRKKWPLRRTDELHHRSSYTLS